MSRLRLLLAAALLAAALPARAEDWTPVEREQFYPIAGASAPELYASIGAHGPQIGIGRAIAFTDFKLTWTRDYRPGPDGTCTLAAARPKLVVTYRLPKPSSRLAPALDARWRTFLEGVRRHEKVHGAAIIAMTREIRAASVGLTAANDRQCRRIREELTRRLAAISAEQRRRSREFDRAEMSEGGNIHRLILGFLNGP
jgi:predicted secreted Zn-dependent protease